MATGFKSESPAGLRRNSQKYPKITQIVNFQRLKTFFCEDGLGKNMVRLGKIRRQLNFSACTPLYQCESQFDVVPKKSVIGS